MRVSASTSTAVSRTPSPPLEIPLVQLLSKIAHVFRVVLKIGLTIEQQKQACFEAVIAACNQKRWELIEECKDELCQLTDQVGRSLLVYALETPDSILAQELIARGISLKSVDAQGNNALHHFARIGDAEAIGILHKHISTTAKNNAGETPLDVAFSANQPYTAITLLTSAELRDKTPQWVTLNSIGIRFFKAGAIQAALAIHVEACDIATKAFEETDPNLITSIDHVANCSFALKDYVQARQFFAVELGIIIKIYKEDHPKVIDLLKSISLCHLFEGNLEEALKLAGEAHSIATHSLEDNPFEVDMIKNHIGFCHFSFGDYETALKYYRQALTAMSLFSDDAQPCMLDSLEGIAKCYESLGNQQEAKQHWREAYGMAKKIFGETDSRTENCLEKTK